MLGFLQIIKGQQSRLADKYAEILMQAVPQEFLYVRATTRGMAIGAFHEAFKAELLHDILDAICGYTDWLATRIVRYKNFRKRALPVCAYKDLKSISEKYGPTVEFLSLFITRLTRPGTDLPLLGQIADDGELVPNKNALRKWQSAL